MLTPEQTANSPGPNRLILLALWFFFYSSLASSPRRCSTMPTPSTPK